MLEVALRNCGVRLGSVKLGLRLQFSFLLRFVSECSKLFSTVYFFISVSDLVVLCISFFHLQMVKLIHVDLVEPLIILKIL